LKLCKVVAKHFRVRVVSVAISASSTNVPSSSTRATELLQGSSWWLWWWLFIFILTVYSFSQIGDEAVDFRLRLDEALFDTFPNRHEIL
jgi:hypothetical protein